MPAKKYFTEEERKVAQLALNRADYARHREKRIVKARRGNLKKYGITVEQYEQMEAAQGGRCAICGDLPKGRRLDVDHDHTTGKARKLLCTNCNGAIGKLKEDPELFRRAMEYLAAHREVTHDA